MIVNPFNTTDLLLHPIKTSEDQGISDIFRGYRKRPMAWNELNRHWIVRSSGSSVYNYSVCTWPFKRQPQKMVKHTQTTRRFLQANCLSVFDHFVGLALKGLKNVEFFIVSDYK